MIPPFQTEELLLKQIREVELWHKTFERIEKSSHIEFSTLVSIQHQKNFELWHKEDIARDPRASDAEIASIKREIDVLHRRGFRYWPDVFGIFGKCVLIRYFLDYC